MAGSSSLLTHGARGTQCVPSVLCGVLCKAAVSGLPSCCPRAMQTASAPAPEWLWLTSALAFSGERAKETAVASLFIGLSLRHPVPETGRTMVPTTGCDSSPLPGGRLPAVVTFWIHLSALRAQGALSEPPFLGEFLATFDWGIKGKRNRL